MPTAEPNTNEAVAALQREHALDDLLVSLDVPLTPTNREQLLVFCAALRLFNSRNDKYVDLWRRRGWFVNLVHMDHKLGRMMRMYFYGSEGDKAKPDADDAYDLINYAAFFIRNLRDNNKLGEL